jgi:hypothetical protein
MSQPTLTVYTAAGGTPIQGEGTSTFGHTWYSVNSGASPENGRVGSLRAARHA